MIGPAFPVFDKSVRRAIHGDLQFARLPVFYGKIVGSVFKMGFEAL